LNKQIAIKNTEFQKHGCPNCGCDYAITGCFQGGGCIPVHCKECGEAFVLCSDTVESIAVGFGYTDENGKEVFYNPEIVSHPHKEREAHKYVVPDLRPTTAEYFRPRGIGYDLAGFVKSKQAGERILEIVKKYIQNPKSWLDWRKHEPTWIQFKFQKEEFDLEMLNTLTQGGVITEEIIKECLVKPKDTEPGFVSTGSYSFKIKKKDKKDE
jgi:hypothetical protein